MHFQLESAKQVEGEKQKVTQFSKSKASVSCTLLVVGENPQPLRASETLLWSF